MGGARKLTKVDRLEVAGTVAPVLRSQDAAVSRRPVKVYKQDTGEVIRVTTLLEAQKGILRTAAIEFDVQETVRPSVRTCKGCQRPFVVERPEGRGRPAESCRNCSRDLKCGVCKTPIRNRRYVREGREHVCLKCRVDQAHGHEVKCATEWCQAISNKKAMQPRAVASRNGRPWVCRTCDAWRRNGLPRPRSQATCAGLGPDGAGCLAPVPKKRHMARTRSRSGRTEWMCRKCAGIERTAKRKQCIAADTSAEVA